MRTITVQHVNYTDDPFNSRWLFYFIQNLFKHTYNVVEVENKIVCDIIIASVFGDIRNIPKYKAKLKLFFTGENLNREAYNTWTLDLLKQHFDLIVGFEPSDIKNKLIRFPLWFMYYPFYEMTDCQNNIIDYITNKRRENIKKTKKIYAGCLSGHNRFNIRGGICDKMSEYGKIIYPGSFRNNYKIGSTAKDKLEFLTEVKYNICPENSDNIGYHTEKIFHALEAGTVPLYWGIDLPEKNIINPKCYQFVDINDNQLFTTQIEQAVNNYDSYINSRIFLDGAKDVVANYYKVLGDNIKRFIDIIIF